MDKNSIPMTDLQPSFSSTVHINNSVPMTELQPAIKIDKDIDIKNEMIDGDTKIYSANINSSLAHVCGNVTSIIFEYLKSNFPNFYFKSNFINTRIALRQFQKIRDVVDLKKEKPVISIQPKISSEPSEFLNNTMQLTNGFNSYDLQRLRYDIPKLFRDYSKKLFVDYNTNRLKMQFDINYIVSTYFQQYDLLGWLMGNVRYDAPFFLKRKMETPIPHSIIKLLSKFSGIPIYDKNGKVDKFLTYLNGHSSSPITYKLKTSTGHDEFFLVTVTSFYINFNGRPSTNDGEKEGQTVHDFVINHTLDIEFNYPQTFFIISKSLTEQDKENLIKEHNESLLNEQIVPLFTIQSKIVPLQNSKGWNISFSFMYEIEDEKMDVTDISSIFNNRIEKLIKYNNAHKIDSEMFIQCAIYKNMNLMKEFADYTISYKDFQLITINGDKDATYRVVFYIDEKYVNEKILEGI